MINAWRTAVHAYLQAQFPEADVVSGEPETKKGVWRGESDRIAVWWPGPWQLITSDLALARPTLALRYSPALSKQPASESPRDPAALEGAADAIIAAFPRPTQVTGFFTSNVACHLASVTPNYASDVWRVDASLIALTLGAAA